MLIISKGFMMTAAGKTYFTEKALSLRQAACLPPHAPQKAAILFGLLLFGAPELAEASAAKAKDGAGASSLASSPPANKPLDPALLHLKKTLKKYHQRSLHARIQREAYISALDKTEKAAGEIYIQGSKFRISMESGGMAGGGGELMVFDGAHLWLQPDRSEKAALKFSANGSSGGAAAAAGLFSSLFDQERFFKTAAVARSLSAGGGAYVYSLRLLSESYGVSKILLSCGRHISQIKIFYEGSSDWQSYRFSNIWFKKAFPESLFAFSSRGFEIMEN